MPESLLGVLKLCLLALLYLFFVRVLWSVWTEIRLPRGTAAGAGTVAGVPATTDRRRDRGARQARNGRRAKAVPGSRLVVREPEAMRGQLYEVDGEITIGRAAGCRITIDDTFASQLHARVFTRDGRTFVEDLGSTNGTYVNGMRVTGEVPIHKGDTVQVGKTVLEAA